MVELDFQLTTDDVLVAVHDWDVEVPGARQGSVEAHESGLLRGDPAARTSSDLFPTLAEVLAEIDMSMPLNLEIKRRASDPARLIEILGAAIAERTDVIVSSFDWPTLGLLRRELPDVPIAPLAKYTSEGLLDAAERMRAASIHCKQILVEPTLVTDATRNGWPVLAFTVNRVEDAKSLFEQGVAGVFTDFPGRLRSSLAAADG